MGGGGGVRGGGGPASGPLACHLTGSDTQVSDISDDLSDEDSLDGSGSVQEESVLRLIEILEIPRHQVRGVKTCAQVLM